MKNPRKTVVSSSFATRNSVGGTVVSESFALRGEPSPEMMELLGRLHSSRDFTVANALKDFADVVVES